MSTVKLVSDENYAIEEVRYLHDAKRTRMLAKDPSVSAVVFPSIEEAAEHIEDNLESGTRFCMHGEWRLPSYTVMEASALPEAAAL